MCKIFGEKIIAQGFGEDDEEFADDDGGVGVRDEKQVVVERHVGEDVDADGSQEDVLPSFSQLEQDEEFDEDGGEQCPEHDGVRGCEPSYLCGRKGQGAGGE